MPGTRNTFLWSRLLLASGVLAAPVTVVLAGMVAAGAMAATAALLAGVAIVVSLAAIAAWHVRDLWLVRQHADRLLHEPAAGPPPSPTSLFASRLVRSIDELHRGLTAERRRLAVQVSISNAILNALPDPLLLLDRERRVVRANEAATSLLGDHLQGRDLAAVLRHPSVLDAVQAVLSGSASNREVEFVVPIPVARDFSARVVALPPDSVVGEAVLLALQDLTSAKRAEQMRADFVANASHELRTPLATLIGFIETLQGAARDDPEAQARFLGIMQEQAHRMARLIRDLLSLSQIELNEHTPPGGLVELREVLYSVADMLQFQAAAKEMPIEIEADETLPPAVGDHDELMQVFQNLIDNAIKYGRSGTPVRVVVRAQPGLGGNRGSALAVAVRDQGDGIAREHLPRLTERFYRVDSARSRALGGTGLGLAIVKHIVNRHRGSLTIDSTVGEGSTFTVFLPAQDLTAAAKPGARRAG